MTNRHAFSHTSDISKVIDDQLRAIRDRHPPWGPAIEYRCDRCEDIGWEPVFDARGERRVTRCSCWTKARLKAAPGVPIDFHDATLVNYEEKSANRHALKVARQWVAEPKGDIYLCGRVGVGKTRLATSMLNDVFRRRGGGGYFTRVPIFLMKLQPSSGEHPELFWQCCTTSVLVLDDVGAERESASDFTRRTLLMLYEQRGDRGLPTIWTSNKSLAELGDFMQDERLASRIAGRAEVLEIRGEDWRVCRRAR